MPRLIPHLLAAVAALAFAPPAAADPDVVAQWHLDSAPGGITSDASGNNHSATLGGGAAIAAGGRFGNALDLSEPNSSSAEVPDADPLRLQSMTVLAWAKASAPGDYRYIIAKGAQDCGGPSSYALTTGATSGLNFYVYDGTTAYPSPDAGASLWDGEWHAIAGTYDGATVRLYVDGTEVGNGTSATATLHYGQSNQALKIGDYPNHQGGCTFPYTWPGLLDELRLYHRALTAQEIAYLHRSDHANPPELPIPPDNGGGGGGPTPPDGGGGGAPPTTPPSITGVVVPDTVTATSPTSLTAEVTGPVDRLDWDVNGDGRTDASCPGTLPSIRWRPPARLGARAAAIAPVRLTATSAAGLIATAEKSVNVNPAPPPAGIAPARLPALNQALTKNPVVMCGVPGVFSNARGDDVFADVVNRATSKCVQLVVAVPTMQLRGCFRPITKIEDVPRPERDAILALVQRRFGATDPSALLKATDGILTTQPMTMNGVELDPADGSAIVVHKQIESVLSHDAAFSVGGIRLSHREDFRFDTLGNETIPLGTFTTLPGGLQGLAGFLLDGDVKVTIAGGNGPDAHADVETNLKLPAFLGGASVDVDARVGADGRFVLNGLHIGPEDFTIPGTGVGLNAFQLDFRDDVWNGEASLCVTPEVCIDVRPIEGVTPPGGVTVGPGDEFRIFANVPFPGRGLALYPEIYLTRIGAGLATPPLRLLGAAQVTAAGIYGLDGALVFAFPRVGVPYRLEQDRASIGNNFPDRFYGKARETFTLAASADGFLRVPVIDERVRLGGGYFLYQFPGLISFGGGLDADFLGAIKIRGITSGDFDLESGRFNLHGNVESCIADIPLLDDLCWGSVANVSTRGAGGCIDLGLVSVGGGVVFEPEVDVLLWPIDGCMWSPFRDDRVGARAAQASGDTVVATEAGDPSRVVELRGADGAPRVRVTAADGTTLESSAESGFTQNDRIRIMRSERLRLTVIGLLEPTTGDNRIALLDASPRVDRVRQATDQPAAQIKATVRGRGARRTLTYDIARRTEQRVTFYEVADGASQEIGTATSGRGRLRFAPAPGSGTRTVEAQFELAGLPSQRITVARFRPPSARLGRAARVRTRHRGTTVRVRWARVREAERYAVVARLGVGGQRTVTTRRRSAVLRNVPRWSAGSVTVQALGTARSGAPSRPARFRRTGRRPKTRIVAMP